MERKQRGVEVENGRGSCPASLAGTKSNSVDKTGFVVDIEEVLVRYIRKLNKNLKASYPVTSKENNHVSPCLVACSATALLS